MFADLGLPNAERKQAKVRLAVTINNIMRSQELSHVAAAQRLRVNQADIASLWNHQLQGLSVECLMNFLTALHRDPA